MNLYEARLREWDSEADENVETTEWCVAETFLGATQMFTECLCPEQFLISVEQVNGDADSVWITED
jgi:hypothetical protein